ncbi:siderophore-interacting protein [Dietzia sp.]|uniref:siderophore-interacting protein n=1 Tax=Dietzia sp. TaxID=1871616 RepID=UPI002FD99828
MSLTTLTVTSREALTPGMVRVHFRADGTAAADAENTDRYVKLVFTASGEKLPSDTNLRELRASLPADEQPRVRTYTVRSADRDSGAVAIDFVTHSGPSVAAAWAEAAEPGDEIQVAGPGGAYVPDPEAHNLLVADPAGLPAALAAIERLPAGSRATLFAEVESPEHELPVRAKCVVEVHWCHSGAAPHDERESELVRRVLEWEWPEGRVKVFAHGERTTMMKDLRPHFRANGVSGKDLSVSGYWRQGFDEDSFQAGKRTDPLVRAAAEEDGKG